LQATKPVNCETTGVPLLRRRGMATGNAYKFGTFSATASYISIGDPYVKKTRAPPPAL
jgi:hypothetical protein